MDLISRQVTGSTFSIFSIIVQTALTIAVKQRTVLVGDDTDLFILLLHYYQQGELYFMSEPKSSSLQRCRFFNIGHGRDVLSGDVNSNILFAHAILGCDTTKYVM